MAWFVKWNPRVKGRGRELQEGMAVEERGWALSYLEQLQNQWRSDKGWRGGGWQRVGTRERGEERLLVVPWL